MNLLTNCLAPEPPSPTEVELLLALSEMKTDKPFPLLDLLDVVPEEFTRIVNLLEPIDQLCLSLVSKQTKDAVKEAHSENARNLDYHIEMKAVADTIEIILFQKKNPLVSWVFLMNSPAPGSTFKKQFRLGNIYCWRNVDGNVTNYEDNVIHTMYLTGCDDEQPPTVLLDHLSYIFNNPYKSVTLTFDSGTINLIDFITSILPWHADKYTYYSKNEIGSILNDVLKKQGPSTELILECATKQDYKFNAPELEVEHLFKDYYAHYFTTEQVLQMKVQRMFLWKTKLTDFDFKIIILTLREMETKCEDAPIQLAEPINLDSYFGNEQIITVSDPHHKSSLNGNALLYKFEEKNTRTTDPFQKHGIHIIRENMPILTVTVIEENVANISIQSDDQNVNFLSVFFGPPKQPDEIYQVFAFAKNPQRRTTQLSKFFCPVKLLILPMDMEKMFQTPPKLFEIREHSKDLFSNLREFRNIPGLQSALNFKLTMPYTTISELCKGLKGKDYIYKHDILVLLQHVCRVTPFDSWAHNLASCTLE